jgi:hypothetical protein
MYLQEIVSGLCIRNALNHVLLFEVSARCRNVDTFRSKQISLEGSFSLAIMQEL